MCSGRCSELPSVNYGLDGLYHGNYNLESTGKPLAFPISSMSMINLSISIVHIYSFEVSQYTDKLKKKTSVLCGSSHIGECEGNMLHNVAGAREPSPNLALVSCSMFFRFNILGLTSSAGA